MRKPEVLSPAGDLTKLQYAVEYGADAVYLSGQRFGMRAAAGNFSPEEMSEGIAYAHERGVRAYVTVNVMPRNEELSSLPAYLRQLQSLGADAVIVADVGVAALCRRHIPSVPLHISTQASLVNYEAANFWYEQGASRVVLARELSLSEIGEIRRRTPPQLELEAFVHGAMCISYSGRCLISNYLTGRDANRGACAQPCRWKYHLMEESRPGQYFPVEEDERGTYLYNSKDLCMIEHIPELVQAGVDSLKIEGRAKTAYYAAGVTGAYRRAVDAFVAAPEEALLPRDILEEIGKVSHRNYYTGFYLPTEEIGQYYEDSHYIRQWDVAAELLCSTAQGRACFRVKNRFSCGDELELMQPGQPPYRFRLEQMWDEEGQALSCARRPMMRVQLALPFCPHPFAMLRREKKPTSQ